MNIDLLKKTESELSDILHRHLKECSGEYWYDILVHSLGILRTEISHAEKRQNL